jgi:hypothetical protein
MLRSNPRVVFFREEPLPDPGVGPKGAQGVPLSPGRSIAVDPQSVPYGTPVWLDTTEPLATRPLRRPRRRPGHRLGDRRRGPRRLLLGLGRRRRGRRRPHEAAAADVGAVAGVVTGFEPPAAAPLDGGRAVDWSRTLGRLRDAPARPAAAPVRPARCARRRRQRPAPARPRHRHRARRARARAPRRRRQRHRRRRRPDRRRPRERAAKKGSRSTSRSRLRRPSPSPTRASTPSSPASAGCTSTSSERSPKCVACCGRVACW